MLGKPDRYERLASQLPMRDPVAGPDQLRALDLRALVGARYGDALLDAFRRSLDKVRRVHRENEYPAFYVGDEGRIAKIHISREGYRIYEAMGRSNMLALEIEHLREFLEEDPSEEADQVRLLLMRMERARKARRPYDRPPETSPLAGRSLARISTRTLSVPRHGR